MALFNRLIADVWSDPHAHVTGSCPSHSAGNDECIWCQCAILARFDVQLARAILSLAADFSRENLHFLLRHLREAGMEHHWEETLADVRRVRRSGCPFDPDPPKSEV